jgi:hypothetical protein
MHYRAGIGKENETNLSHSDNNRAEKIRAIIIIEE